MTRHPDRPFSSMVNDAERIALAEDAEDLAIMDQRKSEESIPFETFVRDMMGNS